MFKKLTGPLAWYVRQIKTTHRAPGVLLTCSALIRNILVAILTPIYVAQLITHFDAPERSHYAKLLIFIVVAAGLAEVASLGLKQTINYGVRRALINTVSDYSEWYLPLVRYYQPVATSISDFFASWREIMSALFTQIPALLVGFGGLIFVSFLNGLTLMGIVAGILAIVAPVVMYVTTTKVRPGVKRASNAERQEMDMLVAVFENFEMSLLHPILKQAMRERSEEARKERNKTSWLVRRRISEVQAINILLVISAVTLAIHYYTLTQQESQSALIVTVVLVLTSNLGLIYQALDAFHNAESRAEGLTDILDRSVKKPTMPPSKAGKAGICSKGVSVTFPIKPRDGGPAIDKVVDIPDTVISRPGLICLSAPSGRGKSTFFNLVISCIDDYEGSVLVGGYEAREYFGGLKAALVKQELKRLDLSIAQLFGLRPEDTSSPRFTLCQQILAWTGFSEAIPEQNVRTLSGGERRRILTAFGLYWSVLLGIDIVILDEPTNDLDEEHILTLCEGLRAFANTHEKFVIFATHDRILREGADQLILW